MPRPPKYKLVKDVRRCLTCPGLPSYSVACEQAAHAVQIEQEWARAPGGYVFVEWREDGQYRGASYPETDLPALLGRLRARGVRTVVLDDREVSLERL